MVLDQLVPKLCGYADSVETACVLARCSGWFVSHAGGGSERAIGSIRPD